MLFLSHKLIIFMYARRQTDLQDEECSYVWNIKLKLLRM